MQFKSYTKSISPMLSMVMGMMMMMIMIHLAIITVLPSHVDALDYIDCSRHGNIRYLMIEGCDDDDDEDDNNRTSTITVTSRTTTTSDDDYGDVVNFDNNEFYPHQDNHFDTNHNSIKPCTVARGKSLWFRAQFVPDSTYHQVIAQFNARIGMMKLPYIPGVMEYDACNGNDGYQYLQCPLKANKPIWVNSTFDIPTYVPPIPKMHVTLRLLSNDEDRNEENNNDNDKSTTYSYMQPFQPTSQTKVVACAQMVVSIK